MNRLTKKANVDKYDGVLNNTDRNIILVGEVVDIDDPINEGRIKVRIPRFDDGNVTSLNENTQKNNKKKPTFQKQQGSGPSKPIINPKTEELLNNSQQSTNPPSGVNPNAETEIVWAIPLLPKHLQILPKKGEKVKILVFDMANTQSNRVWVGPMISQKTNLNYEEDVKAGRILDTSFLNKQLKNVSGNNKDLRTGDKKIGDFRGGFPDKEDVALMGRNNADIILPTKKGQNSPLNSGGEVLIRAGKFNFSKNKLSINTTNPGYLRIKVINTPTIQSISGTENSQKTMSMLFSDYITLISYNNTKVNPIMGSDLEMLSTHNSLSPLVRGDVLVEFLKLLVDYVQNHNHPYHKLPATNANSKNNLEEFDLERLLSQGIRIN
jgi:hypothetical protein